MYVGVYILTLYGLVDEESSSKWWEQHKMVINTTMDDLDLTDDTSLFSSTKQQIQDKKTRLDQEARRVGLQVNIDKTKVMRINAPPRNQAAIKVRGQDIEDVEQFIYLEATVCKEGGVMKDIKNIFFKARDWEVYFYGCSKCVTRVTSQEEHNWAASGKKGP